MALCARWRGFGSRLRSSVDTDTGYSLLCYTYTLTLWYVHLHLDVRVNEHVESALAEHVMDDEVAGPRSLLTAPRGVLPPPSSPPT